MTYYAPGRVPPTRPPQGPRSDEQPRPVPEPNLRWRNVPVGRYAVWHKVDERWHFFEVTRPTDGKWQGWTFLRGMSGKNRFKLDPKEIPRVFAYIEANTAKAIMDYGKQEKTCGKCHTELTDPKSIKRGIGPDCAKKYEAENGLKF